MGERYITTNFSIDNNKWTEDYWLVVQNDWKRQNPSITVGYKYNYPKVKKIIYNFKNPDKPATIVFFDDDSKVVVRCNADEFTKEGGLAQCYLKKILCSRGNIQKLIENADIQE